jgi:hypothetical protein
LPYPASSEHPRSPARATMADGRRSSTTTTVPVPDIAKRLTIKIGKNAGKSPSVAFLYRALAEAEQTAADDGLPIRPKPVRIRHPDDPLTPRVRDERPGSRSMPNGWHGGCEARSGGPDEYVDERRPCSLHRFDGDRTMELPVQSIT